MADRAPRHDAGDHTPHFYSGFHFMLHCIARWAHTLGFLLVFLGSAKADENLLGLPTPRDPARPGAVVLHGGGRITEEQFDRFIELAGGKQARIVVVPSAGYRLGDYPSEQSYLTTIRYRYSSWVELPARGRVQSFQFLYTDDPAKADDPAFVRSLETATGVWFAGGYQGRLNYRFVGEFPRQTRFQTLLRQVVERGGVVGGTSAGMAAMPVVMTMWQDRDYVDGPTTAVAAHGLGILSRTIVEQHFDTRGGRLERFTSLLRDSAQLDTLSGQRGVGARMVGLAVEEGTAVIAQGDRLQVLGDADAHVFIKSHVGRAITWHELGPGDTAQLRQTPAAQIGAVSLHREEVSLAQ